MLFLIVESLEVELSWRGCRIAEAETETAAIDSYLQEYWGEIVGQVHALPLLPWIAKNGGCITIPLGICFTAEQRAVVVESLRRYGESIYQCHRPTSKQTAEANSLIVDVCGGDMTLADAELMREAAKYDTMV